MKLHVSQKKKDETTQLVPQVLNERHWSFEFLK